MLIFDNVKLKINKAMLQAEVKDLAERRDWLQMQMDEIKADLDAAKGALKEAKTELDECTGNIKYAEICAEYGIPMFATIGNNQLEARRDGIQRMIKRIADQEGFYRIASPYTVNGSAARGKEVQNAIGSGLCYMLNSYIKEKEKSLTCANIEKNKDLIEKKFNSAQKKAGVVGLQLNSEYVKLRMELMDIALELKIRQAEEKARLKEERRKLREEAALLAEADKEMERLEAERKGLQKLFAAAVSVEKQREIQGKIAKIDSRVEDIKYRLSHLSAGWLYIATTPCLAGMYKAGCTRQLNPLNRLAQLSSASVPFPFECRGLVYSENVFDLEAKLHKRLDSRRVNGGNRHKEFFHGDPSEAIKILTDEFDVEVHFVGEDWIGETEESEDVE